MKDIVIVGAGGFGREVYQLIADINAVQRHWNVLGFIDDGVVKGTSINNLSVLGTVEDLNQWSSPVSVVLAIGHAHIKRSIANRLNNPNIHWATLIHPTAVLGDRQWLTIGEGSIICAGCILTVQITIGRHVILNLACTVGHDAVIDNFCSLMPSVNVSGEVTIEEGVFVGTGTKIINQKRIGHDSIIGAGAVVTTNIPEHCTAVGAPAKPIKFHPT